MSAISEKVKASPEKRNRIILSREESEILRWLFVEALVPVGIIILISSAVLFFGLQFLMRKITFGNYGLAPGTVIQSVSQFISTYFFIAIVNILLMLSLTAVAIYISLRTMVLPVLRITRELKESIEHKKKITLTVRKSDKLLVPLVELINHLHR